MIHTRFVLIVSACFVGFFTFLFLLWEFEFFPVDTQPAKTNPAELSLVHLTSTPSSAIPGCESEPEIIPMPMDHNMQDEEEMDHEEESDSNVSTQKMIGITGTCHMKYSKTGVGKSGGYGARRNLLNVRANKPGSDRQIQDSYSSYPGTESYQGLPENPFLYVGEVPLSTFSIDVDTASYANVRRFLNQGQWPPKDAVRIEEFINYFPYSFPHQRQEGPISSYAEIAECPWEPEHRLAFLAVQAKPVSPLDRVPCNLVFLLDVSGSMEPANKLPLLKQAMKALVHQLQASDRVGIVSYSDTAQTVLASSSCREKTIILDALDRLYAQGSTNGAEGIQMAYQMAASHFDAAGTNRVILATDGDFNVGITDKDELVRFILEKAKGKIFLSVLGFGMDNLQDDRLERLADKGNGHYAYIDNFEEARKVLLSQANSNLVTVAKDVKIQVEFNPLKVSAFRLIGYENRMLAHRDFNNDRKDAGEMGAGQTSVALYELVPAGPNSSFSGVDPLRYQKPFGAAQSPADVTQAAMSGEWLNIKVRYKQPLSDQSQLTEFPLKTTPKYFDEASANLRFAAAVASFGMLLRESQFVGNAHFSSVIDMALSAREQDEDGYRVGFINFVKMAQAIAPR